MQLSASDQVGCHQIIRPASFTKTHPVPKGNLMIRTPESRSPWTTNTHSSLPVPPPEAHHSLIFVPPSTFQEWDHQNHYGCYLEHLLGIFQLKGNARPEKTETCYKSLKSFVYESGYHLLDNPGCISVIRSCKPSL